jgi:2-haloacid dehalogenase
MTDQIGSLQPDRYRTLSFDCYGTLIDWENGILGFLQPLLDSYDVHVIDEWILQFFSQREPEEEAKGGRYRDVLTRVLESFGTRLAFIPGADVLSAFADSIEYWQPFDDTVPALRRLQRKYQMAVISNIDDDLFELTRRRLGIRFDHVITAQQVGAYKPDRQMFDAALNMLEGPVLHVAQSRYHDIAPALELGLDAVWINRGGPSAAKDVEVTPSATFENLQALADALC